MIFKKRGNTLFGRLRVRYGLLKKIISTDGNVMVAVSLKDSSNTEAVAAFRRLDGVIIDENASVRN